tara:strand:+ start:470 stop:781 length:312 start_codon:yes stop_codon:yes gene_type:complete
MDIAGLISDYGFPVVACVGLGYFIYYVWNYIGTHVKPELGKMHMALIKVIDQTRMLDQDMIRLQQKVNVVLEYNARRKVIEEHEEEEAVEELKALKEKNKDEE